MSLESEFAELQASSWEGALPIIERLTEKVSKLTEVVKREGALVEYVADQDHLYITFGTPRKAVALIADPLVVLYDPDTVDLVSFEIANCTKAVETEPFAPLGGLLSFLKWQPVIQIPPTERDEGSNFPEAIAQGVQRQLAPA